jgi:ATP-dependent RNA helicase DDX52/ROK1
VAPRLPRCDILVATPLLLAAVLRSAGSAQGAAGAAPRRAVLPSVRHLVLDEVDNLLETGFLEQVDEVMSALPTPELLRGLARGADGERAAQYLAAAPSCAVQQAMFTATLPSGIEELAFTVLKNPVRIVAGKAGAAAPAVAQRLLFVGTERGKVMALQGMLAEGVTPPVLVFVQSKERADQVAQVLHQEGVQAGVIHGDRSAAQREEAITAFRRGESMFLVTTDVLGRGLDFKGVNLVVNFDLPQSAVSYVHRVGRTGRAGRQGQAVTFFTEDDIPLLRSIANVMALSGCAVPPWMLQLRQLQQRDKKRLARSAPVRRDVLRGAHGRGGRGGRGGSSGSGGAGGGRPRDGFKLSGGGSGGGRGRRRGSGRE